jgi:serine protease Do
VISGLGRGITAGSPYEGFVEKLDNVIQTDAAISPGNSGGPLLNSEGQVVGVNTAIASEGQNIGFAIPINLVKQLIDTFEKQGSTFERPYIGVRYEMIDKRTAILNDVVEGAYVVSVISGSPASDVGIKEDDIITEIDGKKLTGSNDKDLAQIILNKKVGDTVKVKVYRLGEIMDFNMKLMGTSD